MPYTPPTLAELWKSINDAEYTYSRHIGRYLLSTPSSAPKLTMLQNLIIRVNKQIESCGSDRLSQKEVFSKLVSELRSVLDSPSAREGDEAWCKQEQSAQILLGALIHRYFRIKSEYDSGVTSAVSGVVSTISFFMPAVARARPDIRSCELFKSVRLALDLPREMPDGFLELDLERLDAATTYTALKSFRDYMYHGDHYKVFPHLNNPNFKVQLDDIIVKESERGGLFLLKQLQAIAFLRSLVTRLSSDHDEFEKALAAWTAHLARTYSKLEETPVRLIEAHIEAHAPARYKEKIADLLCTPAVLGEAMGDDYAESTLSISHDVLRAKIKEAHLGIASYTIMGACALILAHPYVDLGKVPKILSSKTVKTTVYAILGIAHSPGVFSREARKIGIQFLSRFNEKELGSTDVESKIKGLDFQFFDSVYGFQTQLSQLVEQLTSDEDEMHFAPASAGAGAIA